MNNGFILYESIIIFLIISSVLLTSLTFINHTVLENKKIEKNVSSSFKFENKDDGKVCDYICLIEKALLH